MNRTAATIDFELSVFGTNPAAPSAIDSTAISGEALSRLWGQQFNAQHETAMKLFNEIKSDKAGRVAKIHAESGKLVRAKQPLIEVDPL